MAEKIIYFGNFEAKSETSKRIMKLQGMSKLKSEVEIPVHYVAPIKDAINVTSSSLSWPVEIAIASANSDEITEFIPYRNADDLKIAAKKVLESEAQSEIIIRKMPVLVSDNSCFKNPLIVGCDFVSFVFDGEILTLGADNTELFDNFNLDPEFVYRFGNNGSKLYFDNLVSRNNPVFKEVISSESFVSLMSNASESLRKSIKANYISGLRVGFSKKAMSLSYKFNIFSDPNVTAYFIGTIVSNSISNVLLQHTGNTNPYLNFESKNVWEDLTNIISTLSHLSSESEKEKISSILEIHSFMTGNIPEGTIEIETLMNLAGNAIQDNSISFMSLHSDMAASLSILNNRSKYEVGESIVNDAAPLKLKSIDGLETEISISKAQVRSTSTKENGVQVRLQLFDIKNNLKENSSEKSKVLETIGNREMDFSIDKNDVLEFYESFDKFSKKFEQLKHSEKSQANTEKMYIPLILSPDGLRAKEDGSMIVPAKYFIPKLKSSSSQFTTVLEMMSKVQ